VFVMLLKVSRNASWSAIAGNTTQLRGHSKDSTTKSDLKGSDGQVNDLGYGNNVEYDS
jgi:hypothetical protein